MNNNGNDYRTNFLGKRLNKHNRATTALCTILFMLVFWMYAGIFQEASESKCLKAYCDNAQAIDSIYCCEHRPHPAK